MPRDSIDVNKGAVGSEFTWTKFMTSFITTPYCSNRQPERVSDVVATVFPFLACYVKHSVSSELHALSHLDKPEPACQHRAVTLGINLFT